MKRSQSGFTMVELVIVIVIIGILAAVAIPKYIDLRQEAANGATNGVAGALSSGMMVNFAARTANSAKGVAVPDCNTPGVLQGGLPAGYTITAALVGPGAVATCTLNYSSGGVTASATFTALGIL